MKTRLFSLSVAVLLLSSLTWAQSPVIVVSTDADLRTVIDTAHQPSIQLGADILLSNSTLSIENGHTVAIDLHGYKLDRGLTKRGQNGGTVITVRGGGYLYLANGTITGGWGGDGGALSVEDHGWAQLTNVTATGNTADNSGGGICVKGSGVLNMSGGAISNNTCNDVAVHSGDEVSGGGLFVEPSASVLLDNVSVTGNKNTLYGGGGICNYGTLTLSGTTAITGNKANTAGGGIWQEGTLKVSGAINITGNTDMDGNLSNLYFKGSALMTVTGDLTGSQIGIQQDGTRIFTSGYHAHCTADPSTIFSADINGMTFALENNEVQINAVNPDVIYYNERKWNGVGPTGVVVHTIKSLQPGSYTLMTDQSGEFQLTDEFYVVRGSVTVNGLTAGRDTVHIILCNGSKLNFVEDGYISVKNDRTLCIHDQPNAGNMGKLVMDAENGTTRGIGYVFYGDGSSGNVQFQGGDIRVDTHNNDDFPAIGTGPWGCEGLDGDFDFFAGKIYAYGGGGAAGIGGGRKSDGCGNITIYGGTIEAIGSPYKYGGMMSGAGIGGGEFTTNGYINILGGHVIARGGHEAAGIGSSQCTFNNDIHVYIGGGYVEAHGDNYAAGIGGGDGLDGSVCEISGGEVYAYGGTDAAGIGGGEGGNGGEITISGGYVYAVGNDNGAGIGGGEDGDGADVTITGGTVIAKTTGEDEGSRAIGPGDGSDNYGKLTLGDNLMVSSERKAAASERKPMCWYRTQVRVEPCDHSEVTYTVDGTTATDHHIAHCTYCLYTHSDLHHFDHHGTCTVCGVKGEVKALILWEPEAQADGSFDGETYHPVSTHSIVPNTKYVLPMATLNVPGYTFIGWEVNSQAKGISYTSPYTEVLADTLYRTGDRYTVTDHVTFVARYKVADITLYDDQPNGETLAQYDGMKVNKVILSGRVFNKNNTWQPLTLPFALSAEELAASPLAGCTLKELDTDSSYNDTENKLVYLYFKDATAIEAGKPYIIRWAAGDPVLSPEFTNVTLTNQTADAKVSLLLYKAIYSPQTFTSANKMVLYLNDNGVLVHPNGQEPVTVGSFRAYFRLTNLMGGDPDADFTITSNIDLPQGIEEVPSDQVQSTKVIRNGLLFIERNGRIYDAQGQMVK